MTRSRKNESGPKKIERTGTNSFNMLHDDGSIFECNVDDKRKLDNIKGCCPKIISFGGIGTKKPLICSKCNERVYKITYIDGKDICNKCSS